MYERLYKLHADDSKPLSLFAGAWTDPLLWTTPEGGFWIEAEPHLVRSKEEMQMWLSPGEEIPYV